MLDGDLQLLVCQPCLSCYFLIRCISTFSQVRKWNRKRSPVSLGPIMMQGDQELSRIMLSRQSDQAEPRSKSPGSAAEKLSISDTELRIRQPVGLCRETCTSVSMFSHLDTSGDSYYVLIDLLRRPAE